LLESVLEQSKIHKGLKDLAQVAKEQNTKTMSLFKG
jgi:hypothetical protein